MCVRARNDSGLVLRQEQSEIRAASSRTVLHSNSSVVGRFVLVMNESFCALRRPYGVQKVKKGGE